MSTASHLGGGSRRNCSTNRTSHSAWQWSISMVERCCSTDEQRENIVEYIKIIYIYILYVLYRHVRQYNWSACRLLPVCEPLCVEELWHDLVQIQHGSIDIHHITYLQTFGNDDKPQLDYVTHFSQPMRWRRHKEVMINLSIAASSN